ncbi:uncharacterized protein LOC133911423 [Phragmites australis]|uniref:uncharacterized protein LOC133911423 n=1 Tax=Phragmites australis TaxID=29695 RepID=UPI002D78B34C|nr:uncharacterized protein LOC133911423 [Phragmites australis]XP_062209641.1 uncharacterized protein LOC133911423 [Phragmites australis]
MPWADEMGDCEETLAALLEVSRTTEGRAALSGALADTIYLLPSSPSHLLLLRLRLLRNLLAGDVHNQYAFVDLGGPAVVASSVLSFLSFPSVAPGVARAALQALGNAALAGDFHRAAVWDALLPGPLREFAGVKDPGVLDPLCMVIDTCCAGEGGRERLVEVLCREEIGLPILVEVVTTASQVEHKEEWIEWLLLKVCVEAQQSESLFRALCSTNDECSDSGEYNAKHAFVFGMLSKCLTNHPKEVTVTDSFALDVFDVHKHAAETVDFTHRGSSPLPTGCPAIDVLGYSLQLLRDICAWVSPSSDTPVPVDSLLQTGLVKRLLKYLGDLEPPSTIRKSMARGQGDNRPALENAKVCPYIGYRRDLVSVIANCLHGRKRVQDEVRQLNGIMLLLQQCVVDEENPYLREWGLLAVKNLLEGNEVNQKEVSELEMQEPVITPEIANIGLKVEIDNETGRPKLVNTP